MRAILLVVLVACGSSSKPTPDGPTPQICEANFETAVNRACVAPVDCVQLLHSDCCGDVQIAVAASGQDAAFTAENTFSMCENVACGARGCQHALQAEDGMVPMGSQSIVAVCINSRCTTTVQ
jgi:hypothetical protein